MFHQPDLSTSEIFDVSYLSVLSLGSVKTGLAKFCGFGQFFLPPCHAACFWRSPSLTSRGKFGVPNRSRRHPSRRMSRYVSWTFYGFLKLEIEELEQEEVKTVCQNGH